MPLKFPLLIALSFILLTPLVLAVEIRQNELVPPYKTITRGNVDVDITLNQVYNRISPDKSTRYYIIRIHNRGASVLNVPSIVTRFDIHLVGDGSPSNYKFFQFEGYRSVFDEIENRTVYYTNWTEIPFTSLSVPAGAMRIYGVGFDINRPFATGQYNISVNMSGIEFFLDPEISACGTISTGQYTITTDFNYTSDTYCLILSDNDISIDGQGHTITKTFANAAAGAFIYQGTSSAGLYRNLNISNLILTASSSANTAGRGLYLISNNTRVTNVTIYNAVNDSSTSPYVLTMSNYGDFYLTNSNLSGGIPVLVNTEYTNAYIYGNTLTATSGTVYNVIRLGSNAIIENNTINFAATGIYGFELQNKTATAPIIYERNNSVTNYRVVWQVADGKLQMFKQNFVRFNFTTASPQQPQTSNFQLNNTLNGVIINATADVTGLSNFILVNETKYNATQNVTYNPYTLNSYPSSSGYDMNTSILSFTTTGTWNITFYASDVPTVSAVELTKMPACSSLGSPVYAGIVLTCKATPSDLNSPLLNVTYSFYRNGTLYTSTTVNNVQANASYCSYNEISVSNTNVHKSDTWLCSSRAYDGLQYSEWVNSTGVTINNTAPVIGQPTINDTSPTTSSILSCNNGSYYDLDGDAVNNTYYRWWKNGAVIEGHTSSTLNLSLIGAAYNDLINCSMIRSDSGYDMKNSTENFSTAVRVQSPPWTTSTEICEGSACSPLTTIYATSSLNCRAYVYDNDSSTIQEMRFNWKLNGSTDHTRFNYSVANASLQYQTGSLWMNSIPTVYLFSKGDTIYCESRAYDGLYYSSYVQSTYYTVNNTAPTADAPTVDNYSPSNTTTITCTGGINYYDVDNDARNATYYLWWRNGANTGNTTATFNLSAANASDGDVLYCESWVEDTGYQQKNSTHKNSTAVTVGTIPMPTITNCSTGFNVLNFSVLDEKTLEPIYATMEATFTLYNYSNGAEFSNVSFYIQNKTSFAYCIYPYAALTIVNSYQTYYPYSGTGYSQRNYYLFNSTLDASSPQQINIYLLNSSISTDYTFQVVNQYLVPISGVKLSMYRFIPTTNAWVIIEQKVTDFSGYALFDLQAGTLYRLVAEASGYVTLNTEFTPGAVTSIQIRMQQDSGTITPVPNFEQVFNDVSYRILPNGTFYNVSAYCELQISSTSSSLQNYSMKITRRYNGTVSVVYFVEVTTSPAGGILNYTASSPGEYTLQISFKHANYSTYSPIPIKFFIGNSSGASLNKEILATGFINGWAYYFFALVCSMLAAGLALRFSPEASAVAGLLILWLFTFLYPGGVIVTVAGIEITVLYATMLTTIMTGAAMVLKWYV